MPDGRKKYKSGFPAAPAPAAAATENCVFPENVMFNIITRLPVKSILRFKAVCVPWCRLFATRAFMKAHHTQLSQNPENQSVIIYHFDERHSHVMCVHEIEPNGELLAILHHPYPRHFFVMDLVGCVNGMICLALPLALGQWIELWNPALGLSKTVPVPGLKPKLVLVSIGFGYDDESDDFKLVRIVHKQGNKTIDGAEVYSANSNSWRTIDVGFQFSVAETKNQAIVNGNPYWVAKLDEEEEVLLMFDVRKMAFKVVVPLSGLKKLGVHVDVLFVNWKGAIAALVSKKNEERVFSLDVWVLYDVVRLWVKHHSFGQIELKVDRFVQCLKNGEIIGVCSDGKLFVLDAVKKENGGGVVKKEIVKHGGDKRRFQIHGYTQSLAYFEGMGKVRSPSLDDWYERLEQVMDFSADIYYRARTKS